MQYLRYVPFLDNPHPVTMARIVGGHVNVPLLFTGMANFRSLMPPGATRSLRTKARPDGESVCCAGRARSVGLAELALQAAQPGSCEGTPIPYEADSERCGTPVPASPIIQDRIQVFSAVLQHLYSCSFMAYRWNGSQRSSPSLENGWTTKACLKRSRMSEIVHAWTAFGNITVGSK